MLHSSFAYWKKMFDERPQEYEIEKRRMRDLIIREVEEKILPQVSKSIVFEECRTPIETWQKIRSEAGNVYGAKLNTENWGFGRTQMTSKFRNLFYIGATSSYPGVSPIICGSMDLVDNCLNRPDLASYKPFFSYLTRFKRKIEISSTALGKGR